MSYEKKSGKMNSPLSIKYNANKEEVESVISKEIDEVLPESPVLPLDSVTPVKLEKNSLINRYFKRAEKCEDSKVENKGTVQKQIEEGSQKKETTSSPMKEYLHRLGKRNQTCTNVSPEVAGTSDITPESTQHETWKLFHDFKHKFTQAVEDMKSRNNDDKLVRDSSVSDSDENSKDLDFSLAETEALPPSLNSSTQNLTDMSERATPTNDTMPNNKDLSNYLDDMKDEPCVFKGASDVVESAEEAVEDCTVDDHMFENLTNSDNNDDNLFYRQTMHENFYSKSLNKIKQTHFMTNSMSFLTFLLLCSLVLLNLDSYYIVFIIGMWMWNFLQCSVSWILDRIGFYRPSESVGTDYIYDQYFYKLQPIQDELPLTRYQGWVNQYIAEEYDPCVFNIGNTKTLFMKLEGTKLRLSFTRKRIAKRAVARENMIKNDITFYKHNVYDLTNAKVLILPNGLVRKRHWSRKYPICIVLQKRCVQTLELNSEQNDSRDSTPKKTFRWKKGTSQSVHTETGLDESKSTRHRGKRKKESTPPEESKSKANQTIKTSPDDATLSKSFETSELTSKTDAAVEEWNIGTKLLEDNEMKLFIFARTHRDKYEWYRHLFTVTEAFNEERTPDPKDCGCNLVNEEGNNVTYSTSGSGSQHHKPNKWYIWNDEADIEPLSYHREFWPYCSQLAPDAIRWETCLMVRYAYDIIRTPYIANFLKSKLQKKLDNLEVPRWVCGLHISGGHCSTAPPIIKSDGAKWSNDGLWLKAKFKYTGVFSVTVQARIDLSETVKQDDETPLNVRESMSTESMLFYDEQKRKSAIYSSDVEDSPESSSDEKGDDGEQCLKNVNNSGSTKKIIKMVDRITTSKYFQQISDFRYIKKAMEGISNTEIKLQLELRELEGLMLINIPPPPHDRIWVGFKDKPKMVLKAKPAFGTRVVRFAHFTNWIEQKLKNEFEKLFVMPNMEDFTINMLPQSPIRYS